MFGFLTDPIENAIDVSTETLGMALGGDGPNKRKIAKLVSDGVEIYAVAQMFGVGEDVILSVLGDD